MKAHFDFIVMASHHSGTKSIEYFLNSFDDMRLMQAADKPLDPTEIEDFLAKNHDKTKGLMLQHSMYSQPAAQDILSRYVSPECAVLEISREPLAKLISILNFHIYNWALTFIELYWLTLQSLDFGTVGNSAYTKRIISSPMMDAPCTLGPLLREKYPNYTHIPMEEINPEHANSTLNKFRVRIGLPAAEIQFPVDTVFSRQNFFSHFIRAMYFKGVALRPCPLNHLSYRGYTPDDICLSIDQAEVNFTLGQFTGKLAFCFYGKNLPASTKEDIRKALEKDHRPVIGWCNAMSRLYEKALMLYEMFAYDEEKLRDKLLADTEAATLARKYFGAYFDYYARYEPQYMAKCLPSLQFFASIWK